MKYSRHTPAALLTAAALLGGCASVPPLSLRGTENSALRECAEWIQRLDATIDESGARDAEAHRMPGFPYLRSNRFLASFAMNSTDATGNRLKFHEWLQAMRDLDQHSRDVEIQNLPSAAVHVLLPPGKAALRRETRRCAGELLAADAVDADTPARLQIASEVPDSYSTALRALGLYPLTSIPFFAGVARWQVEAAAVFSRATTLSVAAERWIRYTPAATGIEDPSSLLARVARNSFGVPQLSPPARDTLLDTYSPIFDVETVSDDDRPGALTWRSGSTLSVDTRQPAIYRRIAFTRFGKDVLTQLIYTVWFPRRPATGRFDLLAGEFDGVMIRITLGPDGKPLIADSMHACGCYHMFFPGPRLNVRPAPHKRMEWAFVPAPLPALSTSSRLVIRLASATHYVTGIGVANHFDGVRYDAVDEDILRTLPTADGKTRSIYGTDGLIDGSARGERFLFWPMGIASTGAMRQWGRHATAFVGRRHFDDPDLLERRFEMAGETPDK